ncbi:unnamed protein product [Lymnaea stagnalis]|uniref:Ankyrin repeat protein n=1 Tax=Lymnaea stagnalis TaxID=6523 RepID=A0AAV2I4N4_LYMST
MSPEKSLIKSTRWNCVSTMAESLDICEAGSIPPLMRAVLLKSPYNTIMLIRGGADLDATNADGETAVMKIVQCASVFETRSETYKIFTYLVNHGAKLNLQNNYGETALMLAVKTLGRQRSHSLQHCDERVIEMLIDNGANVNLKDNEGNTALAVALKNGAADCLNKLLISGADAGNVDFGNELLNAIRMRHMGVVRALIEMGQDLTIKDEVGNTPLMLIIDRFLPTGNDDKCSILLDLVQFLVHRDGSDVNTQNLLGATPLMISVSKPFRQNVTGLLDLLAGEGAKLDTVDKYGNTALTHALTSSNDMNYLCPSVNWLLENGADPFVGFHNFNVIGNFIDRFCGCDMSRQRHSKFLVTSTHINYLIARGDDQFIRMLVCNGIINTNCATNDQVDQMVAFGMDPKDIPRLSPFMFAMLHGREDIAKYFVANCYLTDFDVRYRPGNVLEAFMSDQLALLRDLYSQPWPLAKLAFIAVSSALGSSPGRTKRIEKTQLPERMMRMLSFQEPISRLCTHNWEDIPVYTRDYDPAQRGRPLLYYWPFGKAGLTSCDECRTRWSTNFISVDEPDGGQSS